MPTTKSIHTSSLCLAASAFLLVAFGLFVFYVPTLTSSWAESGEALGQLQILLIQRVQLAQQVGFIVLPLLLVGFIACLIWRIYHSKAS